MKKGKRNFCKGRVKFCGWLLRKMGWTGEGIVPEDPKFIVLGAPHTSIWDFVISYLYYSSLDEVAHVMIKKELFFFPLGPILRACGCIPVDRSSSSSLVKSLIEQMNDKERFCLAIAPEGTRKPVAKWKAGALLIARETGVPVYCGYFDWGTKHIGCGQKIQLTGDLHKDIKMVQDHYESLHLTGKHKENYITH